MILTELKALAEKATNYESGEPVVQQSVRNAARDELKRACSPDVILGLIAENERLRAALVELVACKDERSKTAGAEPTNEAEYQDRLCLGWRNDRAWSAARAALGVER